MPNYDQWLAPFYLSWYQPGQINLSYSMIITLANAKGIFTETRKLHVVDFGRGTLAMQFGVALAAADAIRDGQIIDEILMDSLDSSTAMINIGMKLWERFKMKVKEDSNLAELNQANNVIDARINEIRCKPKDDTVRWLSAMHAVYDGNKDDVSRWLQGIQLLFSLDAGFLTTHNFKKHLLLAAPLFSENNYKGKFYRDRDVSSQLEGVVEKTTAWRRALRDSTFERSHYPDDLDIGRIKNYLKSNVTWERQLEKASIHIYHKWSAMAPSTNQTSLFAGRSEGNSAPCPSPQRIGKIKLSYKPVCEILNKATGFMNAYEFTLNPYSGCSFGCAYCYAAFFSPTKDNRDNWGRWVVVKENAVERLRKRKPGALDGKMIYMSSVTDPYQLIERRLRITRGLLELVAERHKPKLVVQTRSPLVVRDCDLFRRIEDNGGRVQVNMTVTTDDGDVRRAFEPFCPSNPRRLAAVKEVQDAGIATCITMTPLLLVSNNGGFADELIDTGVKKFIARPFHFVRGKFVASTRDVALNLMI